MDTNEKTPAWVKVLTDAQAKIKARLDQMDNGASTKQREQALTEALKGTHEYFSARELKKFNRMKFETEDDFSEYLADLAGEATSHRQGATQLSVKNKPASQEEINKVMSNIM